MRPLDITLQLQWQLSLLLRKQQDHITLLHNEPEKHSWLTGETNTAHSQSMSCNIREARTELHMSMGACVNAQHILAEEQFYCTCVALNVCIVAAQDGDWELPVLAAFTALVRL